MSSKAVWRWHVEPLAGRLSDNLVRKYPKNWKTTTTTRMIVWEIDYVKNTVGVAKRGLPTLKILDVVSEMETSTNSTSDGQQHECKYRNADFGTSRISTSTEGGRSLRERSTSTQRSPPLWRCRSMLIIVCFAFVGLVWHVVRSHFAAMYVLVDSARAAHDIVQLDCCEMRFAKFLERYCSTLSGSARKDFDVQMK